MNIAERDRKDLLKSKLFDANWYRTTYPDVAESGMDAADHFLWIGHRLRRNPSPHFDTARYVANYADLQKIDYNPVLHYLRFGRDEGRKSFPVQDPKLVEVPLHAPPVFEFDVLRLNGNVQRQANRPNVLLCAHVVGSELFGSERSLLDMLRGLRSCDFNVVVAVPQASNKRYIEMLQGQACGVVQFPYGWWRKDQPVREDIVACFAQVISDERIDVVHVNTIMLREPLLAAKRIGIRSVVHARELIREDEKLLELIDEPADKIVDTLWHNTDAIIANSKATAACFDDKAHSCSIVYNTADIDDLLALPLSDAQGPLRVGLISSNLPKKGLGDFCELARRVSETRDDVEFRLIGPLNEHSEAIAEQIAKGELPKSLHIAGYAASPVEAISGLDVVLSISTFQESFGRTVLEASAGGRPVIVYDRGAPPELVIDGETGYIVPFGDVDGLVSHVEDLANDRIALLKMGLRARDHARVDFGHEAYADAMRRAYDALLEKPVKPEPMLLGARGLRERIPRDKLKIAYFCWHFPVPSETFVLNELRLLVEAGMDVTVFCKQSPYPDFEPDFPITWERVRDADHLAQRLVETGRNIVHGHFVIPTVSDMVWPAAEKAGIPFTCIAHAQDIFRYRNAVTNRIDEFARSPNCLQIFTLSRFHRQYLVDRGVPAEKITINSNCIDPELFAGGKVPDRAARARRSICAVSRFADKKGLEILVHAGKLLEPDGIKINIYGYGPMEDLYRSIIDREGITNVEIHGPVKGRDALMEVFRDHDLFACPSVRAPDGDMDGIPTTLMESMAAGLPVLTTRIAGIPDLVLDGITGFLCDATPEDIAQRIRDFYALPERAIEAMIEDAEARLRLNHNGPDLVDTLLRFWANETVDLMIVAWNNLQQTSEVIRRLYEFTSLPFHLIVCDNGSSPPALAHLLTVYAQHENFSLLLNRENSFVGGGTNKCIDIGSSDYVIYVCGKEGMTTNFGWEKKFVKFMNANPRVGQAGTLCHSPSYLHGKDYPTGVPLFDKFRNQDFATEHPDRVFAHIQGGFFVIRRETYDEIGGFSDVVNHSYTDVEYSYYVESCGWELGEVPGLMALFNKTRPGLGGRVDESHGALHPPFLHDLPWLDRLVAGGVRRCNICETQGEDFEGDAINPVCPNCGSTRRARSLHRALAESTLLYQRNPAVGIEIPDALMPFWKQQFQGPQVRNKDLQERLSKGKGLENRTGGMQVMCLNETLDKPETRDAVIAEAARLLAPGGTLFVVGDTKRAEYETTLLEAGFQHLCQKRFTSEALQFDWQEIGIYARV